MGVRAAGSGASAACTAGVDHLAAEKAAAQFAAHAQPLAGRQRLLLRRVEVQEAQHQRFALVVAELRHQLPPLPQLDAAFGNRGLDLHRVALAGVGQAVDAGGVFVAQRQVQRQVDVAQQAELVHRPLRG